MEPPSLNKFSLDDLPVMTLSAFGKMDEAAFYDLMDKRIAPVLYYLSVERWNGYYAVYNLQVGGSRKAGGEKA